MQGGAVVGRRMLHKYVHVSAVGAFKSNPKDRGVWRQVEIYLSGTIYLDYGVVKESSFLPLPRVFVYILSFPFPSSPTSFQARGEGGQLC